MKEKRLSRLNFFSRFLAALFSGIKKGPSLSAPEAAEAARAAMKAKDWPAAERYFRRALAVSGPAVEPDLQAAASALAALASWPAPRRCNLCGCTLFMNMGSRKNVRCMNCHSLERTRLLALYFFKFVRLQPGARVLHLAPERGLYEIISRMISPENYETADFHPERYPFAGNIRALDLCRDAERLPENHYDLIIHSHVLEHVPCDYGRVLKHLHAALKPDGLHLCVIPFMSGFYDESFDALSEEEAVRRFGQNDHVRRFGAADIDKTLGRVLAFDPDFDATRIFTPEELLAANVPEKSWKGLTPDTVLCLKREHCLLL